MLNPRTHRGSNHLRRPPQRGSLTDPSALPARIPVEGASKARRGICGEERSCGVDDQPARVWKVGCDPLGGTYMEERLAWARRAAAGCDGRPLGARPRRKERMPRERLAARVYVKACEAHMQKRLPRALHGAGNVKRILWGRTPQGRLPGMGKGGSGKM